MCEQCFAAMHRWALTMDPEPRKHLLMASMLSSPCSTCRKRTRAHVDSTLITRLAARAMKRSSSLCSTASLSTRASRASARLVRHCFARCATERSIFRRHQQRPESRVDGRAKERAVHQDQACHEPAAPVFLIEYRAERWKRNCGKCCTSSNSSFP